MILVYQSAVQIQKHYHERYETLIELLGLLGELEHEVPIKLNEHLYHEISDIQHCDYGVCK
jgi:hypothetical protein